MRQSTEQLPIANVRHGGHYALRTGRFFGRSLDRCEIDERLHAFPGFFPKDKATQQIRNQILEVSPNTAFNLRR
jgi:hypothetical protein